jgi:hypothetical protein
MIVLVNEEEEEVTVINGKIVTKLTISDISKISDMLSGKKVHYVSEISEVDGDDIVELCLSINSQEQNEDDDNSGEKWIHATGNGVVNMKGISFNGPDDFKPLSKVSAALENYYVQRLIQKGKLEIVSTEKMKIIRKQNRNRRQKIDEKEDAGLSELIVDLPVSEYTKSAMYKRKDMPSIEVNGDDSDDKFISDEQKNVLKNGWGKKDDE